MRRFPRHRLQRKLLVSDHGMHHGTCVTHVPCCMSGSLTRGGGENIPSISGTCATGNYMYLIRGPLVRQVKQPCATCQQKGISLYLQGSCLSTLAALMSCLNITIELPCSHKHNIPNCMKEVTWLMLCPSTNGHRSAGLGWLPFIWPPVFAQAAMLRSW